LQQRLELFETFKILLIGVIHGQLQLVKESETLSMLKLNSRDNQNIVLVDCIYDNYNYMKEVESALACVVDNPKLNNFNNFNNFNNNKMSIISEKNTYSLKADNTFD